MPKVVSDSATMDKTGSGGYVSVYGDRESSPLSVGNSSDGSDAGDSVKVQTSGKRQEAKCPRMGGTPVRVGP